MIAALPMYDRGETRDANDRLWALIRARLGHGPKDLTRGRDPWEIWQSRDLLLAQTCGLPYRTKLHRRTQLVGAPDHRLKGCAPGYYRSVLVVRAGDENPLPAFADAAFAVNDAQSQSGWAAAQTHAGGLGFRFRNPVWTGAHRDSARAVAQGGADIAALDAISWDMMRQYDGFATKLRVIAKTAPTPALPFITGPLGDPAALFDALGAAIGELTGDERAALRLYDVVRVEKTDYLAVPTPPGPAMDPAAHS